MIKNGKDIYKQSLLVIFLIILFETLFKEFEFIAGFVFLFDPLCLDMQFRESFQLQAIFIDSHMVFNFSFIVDMCTISEAIHPLNVSFIQITHLTDL